MGKGLIRSSKALSVMNKFERKDAVLYVEGPTDRVFWNIMFDIYKINNISINIAGSCTAIDSYIYKIINENIPIFVARDKDYKYHLNKIPPHNRVLLTFGHSIENSLICPQILTDITTINGGEYSTSMDLVIDWQSKLINSVKELIIREFANEISQSGISVFGDHYEYICGKKSKDAYIPIEKINKHLEIIDAKIPNDAILQARRIYESMSSQSYWYIKGHFLFSIAVKFLKSLISKINDRDKDINLSNDAMNMLFSQQFKFNLITGNHPHKDYYDGEMNKLKSTLIA
ncbi:DUF4435 domain-containing protein [Citrobacter sp. wls716]|uniref:DUF4435 domain-containing protein n=1 Tax=Citrobacter sp. wls716 TaxID=2576420 RepID=UPI0010C9C43C|nr:DUF4435 domain-containing protein [Citrobacter sp. wls716]TKU42275.1 DUF4435 domain-containing protein [Citrobacter sp. wls716]